MVIKPNISHTLKLKKMKTYELITCFFLSAVVGALLVIAWNNDVDKAAQRVQRKVSTPTLKVDYQIVIQEHEYVLMDGDRVVGVLYQEGQLDSLVTADNE